MIARGKYVNNEYFFLMPPEDDKQEGLHMYDSLFSGLGSCTRAAYKR